MRTLLQCTVIRYAPGVLEGHRQSTYNHPCESVFMSKIQKLKRKGYAPIEVRPLNSIKGIERPKCRKIQGDCKLLKVSKNQDLNHRGYIGLILIGIIHLYRYSFSAFMGRNCRFLPTCSEYMIEAIKLHGSVKGTWLGLKRLLRCQPYGSDGFDPVPPEMPNIPKNIKKENP